ncbi:hypothetical protein [Carnimonas bestiolae]|uniref:hypothetical protein n=1 Tax=Carnimonas bestiolae TaxID=3402172 RepID=UPI003EDB8EB4
MSAIPKEQYQHIRLERTSLSVLRELAKDSEHPQQDDAAREYVGRLFDLELERRLDIRHRNSGYAPISPTALAGELVGGGIRSDAMVEAYDRGIGDVSYWHEQARKIVGMLSVRGQIAALIRTAKSDHRRSGEWSCTYDQIAANISYYCKLLGFGPTPFEPEVNRALRSVIRKSEGSNAFITEMERECIEVTVPEFKDGRAIKNCAQDSAYQLIRFVKI